MLLIKLIKENVKYSVHGKSISICICPDQPGPITIEEPEVYKENELITDFGTNFQGRHRFTAEEAALSIVKAYINNDKSYEYSHVIPYLQNFVDGFVENSNLQTKYTSEDGSEHSRWIPLKYFGENILPLQLVDADGCAYYSDGVEFIIVRADGSLATDYEFLYENSMIEALEKGGCKYESEETKKIVL